MSETTEIIKSIEELNEEARQELSNGKEEGEK